MKVSIVIPAYNEEKRIGRTLEAYSDYFERTRKEGGFDYEILISINNTKDKTEEIVRKFSRKNKKIIYINLVKGGKGYAITEGWKDALKRDNDLIGFVDADMSTSPKDFYDLIKNIGNYNGIITNRYMNGSVVSPKQHLTRILVSRLGNFIIRSLFLFSYRDTQCGAKLFTRKSLEKIIPLLGMTKWAFDVDLLYNMNKQGFKIKQCPTFWKDADSSTLNVKKASIQAFLAVLQLRIVKSPFKRILKPFKPIVGILWRMVR